MMKVTLPILYYSGGDALSDLGVSEKPKVAAQQIFYSIDSIAPAKDDTYIYSGGETFVCPKPIHEVERIIDYMQFKELIVTKNN